MGSRLTFSLIHSYFDWNVFLSFFSEFESKLHAYSKYSPRSINWVDWPGNSAGVAVLELSKDEIDRTCYGDRFRDPVNPAREVHNIHHQWQDIIGVFPSAQQVQVLTWIKDKVYF